MSAIHHGYFAAHRGTSGLVVDHATDSSNTGWWTDADPKALNVRAETIAVGTTDTGQVVFYNPKTQPGIRRLGPAEEEA